MKQIAKISGIAYVMIFIGGFYANFAVLESLVVNDDPVVTTVNFINNHSQFGFGLLGFVLMLIFDILLVWTLFDLTKQVNKKLTFLASSLRLLHAVFFSMALFKLWTIFQITMDKGTYEFLPSKVMPELMAFDRLWTIGLLFFGFHLIVLGVLTFKSNEIPKELGIVLIIAALGYLIDSTAKMILESYNIYQPIFETMVVCTGVLGELSFTIWLLYKGFKKERIKIQIG